MVIGVFEEAREHFHHARIQPTLVGRTVGPRFDIRIVARELRVRGDDAKLLLPRKGLLSVRFPAIVEGARVTISPFPGHVMRRVHRAGGEIQEERLRRRDLLRVGDKLNRLIGQVFGQVIAFGGRFRRFDLVLVVDEIRVVLVGVAAEEPVVAIEAATKWPTVVRAGGRDLVGRRQVPLANGVGVVALLMQDLGEKAVFEWDVAIRAGIPG